MAARWNSSRAPESPRRRMRWQHLSGLLGLTYGRDLWHWVLSQEKLSLPVIEVALGCYMQQVIL